jgi:ribosomal protein S24E
MNDPIPEDTPPRTEIINHIVKICGFSSDSLMVKYIDQQQWSELAQVVMHGLEDSKSFEVFRDDEITIDGKPMLIHQKLFQSFLLYYK